MQNSYKTWQPRIGFAYDLTGNGKTVLRAGFGMFFERVQGNDVYNAALNPPFAYQPSATNVYFSNPNTSASDWRDNATAFPVQPDQLKYNYPPPGTADFSFGFQREVAPSVVAVMQYVGSRGWDQNNDRQINTLPLADLTAPAAGCHRQRQREPVAEFPRLCQHQPGGERDQLQLPLAPGRHSR